MVGVLKITWAILKSFCRESSIAGLNNAAKASSAFRIVYWLVIFGAFLGLTLQERNSNKCTNQTTTQLKLDNKTFVENTKQR
jgi:hypothetical protein